jgi:hypothetical protein
MAQVAREPFDRDHILPLGARHRGDAGTDRVAVEVNHAATADGHPAAILRAGQPEVFAQNPEQRLLRFGLYDKGFAIYSERNLPHQFTSFVNLFRTSAADKWTVSFIFRLLILRKPCFKIGRDTGLLVMAFQPGFPFCGIGAVNNLLITTYFH